MTGTALVPDDVAREAVGEPPASGTDIDEWGQLASQRIVSAYLAKGYDYARAWFSSTKEPGVLWFDVDEGRVRVTFSGIGSVTASLFRLLLDLPGGVFQRQRFESSLAEAKKRLNLADVRYEVHDVEGEVTTVLGNVVPERALQIFVARTEFFGWSLDIAMSAAWGLVPSLSYSVGDLWRTDDHMEIKLELAFPYRQYIFEQAARIQWVHGRVDVSYRLPHFQLHRLRLAPRFDSTLDLSHYARADLQLSAFYLLRNVTVQNLVLFLRHLQLTLGAGGDFAQVLFTQTATSASGTPTVTPPSDVRSARGLLRTTAQLVLGSPWTRRDQRSAAGLSLDFCLPAELRAIVTAQLFKILGRHRLIIRGRGVALAGAVPYWDDVELAGDYQRVFFGDRYWVHSAVQLETAYRITFWRRWFEAGVFHDVSLFEDRFSTPHTVRVIDAFGPSLHFLILDLYALSIHQGLGFAAGKFDQTISLTVNTVF